jgi:hypothetical protein
VALCTDFVPRTAPAAQLRPHDRLASHDVSEQVFPSGDWTTDDDRATALVSELLERLLEAISRPAHDWPELSRQATEIAHIAEVMARSQPTGPASGSPT